jgi:hypothetical protein
MDKPGNIESLAEIGRAAAKEQVKTNISRRRSIFASA